MIDPRPVANPAAALVDGGEVAVEVARVAASRRDVAAGGGDLAQRLAVVGHVDEHHEHVEPEVEGKMLGDGQGETRREEPLDDGVRGGVDDEHELTRRLALLETGAHRRRVGVGDTHRPEHDPERRVADACLRRDLDGQLEVRQAADREDGQLLAAHDRGQRVHDRDAGDDGLAGRVASGGVDGEPGHLAFDVRQDRRASVDGIAAPVALTTQPGLGHRDRQRVTRRTRSGTSADRVRLCPP